jgi:hypothetical protein
MDAAWEAQRIRAGGQEFREVRGDASAPIIDGGTQGGTPEETRAAAAAFGWCLLGCLIGLLAALAGYWWTGCVR